MHNFKKTRSDMLIKYFSERVAPGVHDAFAKKQRFGVWKEQFMHHRFANHEEFLRGEIEAKAARAREEATEERKVHTKTRSDLIVKYFSERAGPAIHDAPAQTQGFGIWKEQSMHDRFLKREEELGGGMLLNAIEEARARAVQEAAKERQVHTQTRSDMLIKYFSEKVAPGVHGKTGKYEAFGAWKEQFMHHLFPDKEALRKAEMEAAKARNHEMALQKLKNAAAASPETDTETDWGTDAEAADPEAADPGPEKEAAGGKYYFIFYYFLKIEIQNHIS
jgi:hypothetical protein